MKQLLTLILLVLIVLIGADVFGAELNIKMPDKYLDPYCYIYPIPDDWTGTQVEWVEANIVNVHIIEKVKTGQERKDAADVARIRLPITGIESIEDIE